MDLENNWSCFSPQQPFTSWKTITRPLFPKLNKPSLIRLFSQVNFSKLLHPSCSSLNFFPSFFEVQHPKCSTALEIQLPHCRLPWPISLVNTLQKGFCPGFLYFSFFFPHRLWFSTSPSPFSGILLQNHVSVMALGGILNAFLCCDTAEVCNTVEMKVKNLYLVQHKWTYVIFFVSVNSLLKRLGFSITDIILFWNIYYNIISIL